VNVAAETGVLVLDELEIPTTTPAGIYYLTAAANPTGISIQPAPLILEAFRAIASRPYMPRYG